MIRLATEKDLDAAVELLLEFKNESLIEYGLDIDIESLRKDCSQYIGTTFVCEVYGKVVGILAGKKLRIPAVSTPVYLEQVWYVSKEHRRLGVRLIKHLETWCLANGIKHVIMAHMMNSKADKLGAFYRMNGYVPYEINYIKQLTGGNNEKALA